MLTTTTVPLTTSLDLENTTEHTAVSTTETVNSTTSTPDAAATKNSNESIASTTPTYLADVEEIDDLEINSKIEEGQEDGTEEEEDEQHTYSSEFTDYIQMVQSTLMRNAHRNIKSKTAVLENLRDHLLIEIGDITAKIIMMPLHSSHSTSVSSKFYAL